MTLLKITGTLLLLVVGLGQLTACGPTDSTPSRSSASYDAVPRRPELEHYRQSFLYDAERWGAAIPSAIVASLTNLELTDQLPEMTLGRCIRKGNEGDRKIEITFPELWPSEYPSIERFKFVVYHELGHCFLNLGHSPGTALAIMRSPSPLNEEVATIDWTALLTQLFTTKEVTTERLPDNEPLQKLPDN